MPGEAKKKKYIYTKHGLSLKNNNLYSIIFFFFKTIISFFYRFFLPFIRVLVSWYNNIMWPTYSSTVFNHSS